MNEPKVAVLRHYASPYYDPQKAHEYYMRTRELKGRSTTSLNDEGKKIWSYTKNNIKSEKTAKVKEEQEKRDQKITELRAKADATKKQISSRLKELNEALTQNASDRKKASILIKILIWKKLKRNHLARRNESIIKRMPKSSV